MSSKKIIDINVKVKTIEIIKNKRAAEAEKERLRELFPHEIGEYEGDTVSSNIGRYGPYLTYRNENFRLPRNANPLEMTLEEAIAIIANAGVKKPRGRKKKAE